MLINVHQRLGISCRIGVSEPIGAADGGKRATLGVPKQHLYSSPIGFTEQFAVLSVKSIALAYLFRQHNVSGSRHRELECPPPATSSSPVRLANETPTECPALPSSSLMPALTYMLIVGSPMS